MRGGGRGGHMAAAWHTLHAAPSLLPFPLLLGHCPAVSVLCTPWAPLQSSPPMPPPHRRAPAGAAGEEAVQLPGPLSRHHQARQPAAARVAAGRRRRRQSLPLWQRARGRRAARAQAAAGGASAPLAPAPHQQPRAAGVSAGGGLSICVCGPATCGGAHPAARRITAAVSSAAFTSLTRRCPTLPLPPMVQQRHG